MFTDNHAFSGMAAMRPEQIERKTTTTDGKPCLLFHTGWSTFSNFYTAPFTVDGQRYSTVEQYYQVQKAKYFGDSSTVIAMLKVRSPRRCKELGKNIVGFNKADWATVAEGVMFTGVQEKFLQNANARKVLTDTKGMLLAEATQYDNYWANGLAIDDEDNADVGQWPGRNTLGRILMKIRDSLLMSA